MDFYQIRYFLALCDTLNFRRAAERCNVSQPSLTRAIQKLEQGLGEELIRREHRRTHLTELGQVVRPILQEMLDHVDQTRSAARTFLERDDPELKLGILTTIGPAQFSQFLAQFAARHPALRLTFVEADSATLREHLLLGHLNHAVDVYRDDAGGRLKSHLLYHEGMVAVIPVGHPFERKEALRLRDLDGARLLLQANSETQSTVIEACRKLKVAPNIVRLNAGNNWIQAMVAAGAGVTIMPEHSTFSEGIRIRPIAERGLTRAVSLIVVAGRPHHPNWNLLVRELRAHRWQSTNDIAAARLLALSEAPELVADVSVAPLVRDGALDARLHHAPPRATGASGPASIGPISRS
jgi:DNA-binding transcriptional LysR family regulator